MAIRFVFSGSSLGNGSRPPPTSKLKVMDSAADFPGMCQRKGRYPKDANRCNKLLKDGNLINIYRNPGI